MEYITRTAYGSLLQTCLLMDLPFTVKENSTLNEKFGVQSGVIPVSSVLPKLNYFAIGNGGHRLSVGSNGIPKPEPVQHLARHAALFNHLPFLLREVNNDLSPAERAKYGMRREETYNNTRYIAYYLKRLDLTNVTAELQYKTITDGNTVTTPFTPTSSDLNPVPPDLTSSGTNVVTGDYIAANAITPLIFDAGDVAELLNVANIIYGDESYAIISEIGLVSGVDKPIQFTVSGQGTFTYNEVIAAQICTFMNTFFPAKFSNTGITMSLNVGCTEPLFELTN